MSDTPLFSAAYQQVLAAGTPYTPPDSWNRLNTDGAAVCCPADPEALLESLRCRFPLDLLRRSGVVSADPAGGVELNPLLRGPENFVLAVRGDRPDVVFDLITARGCLSSHRLPALAILRDEFTWRALRDRTLPLCVAFSLPDVVILRSLGLPATLGSGLAELGRSRLMAFCHAFGLGRGPHAFSTVDRTEPDLLCLGWSPSRLSTEAPARLWAVAEHFTQLHRHLGIGMDTVRIWSPTEADLRSLRFCMNTGRVQDIRSCVVRSLKTSSRPLIPCVQRPEQDAAHVLLQLQELAHGRGHVTDREASWQRFSELLHNEIVRPQVENAQAESDPQRRSLLMLRAELHRELQTLLTSIARMHSTAINEARQRRRRPVLDPELQSARKAIDQVLRSLARIERILGD